MLNKNNKISKTKIQTWFITGASSGIGHEMARQLLERGYNVIAIARRIPDFNSENALCLSCDVTNPQAVKNAINAGIERFGKIDVLVNNAGVLTSATIEDETIEHLKEIFEVNFFGAFNTMNAMIPHFRKMKNGTIVNNTSQSAFVARKFGTAYCASKAALESLTGVCHRECTKFIRTMAFELGYFPASGIKSDHKFSLKNIPYEYKNLKNSDVNIKYDYENNLVEAIKCIIDEVEKEKITRRLVLGLDAILNIKNELKLFNKDYNYSKQVGAKCFEVSLPKLSFKSVKNHYFYYKYRILKNFVSGETKIRYKKKQKKYKLEIK